MGPAIRCLDCAELVDRSAIVRGRCGSCARRRKAVRNAEAVRLGPVPAGSRCWLCGRGELAGDPMTWDHRVAVAAGGAGGSVRPAHRSCNARRRDRR